MYPETDVPPVEPDVSEVEMPELLTEKVDRYRDEYGLDAGLAEQVAYGRRMPLFEELVAEGVSASEASGGSSDGVDATLAAGTLESTLTALRRDEVPVENLTETHLRDAVVLVDEGEVPNEGMEDLLTALAENPDLTAAEAVEAENLGGVDESEVRKAVAEVIERNADQVEQEGMGAFSGLMGEAMGALRGKADGDLVSEVLREEIQKRA
jgi:glutamyl-tRNA(Gln) amidotransferase subunit E